MGVAMGGASLGGRVDTGWVGMGCDRTSIE